MPSSIASLTYSHSSYDHSDRLSWNEFTAHVDGGRRSKADDRKIEKRTRSKHNEDKPYYDTKPEFREAKYPPLFTQVPVDGGYSKPDDRKTEKRSKSSKHYTKEIYDTTPLIYPSKPPPPYDQHIYAAPVATVPVPFPERKDHNVFANSEVNGNYDMRQVTAPPLAEAPQPRSTMTTPAYVVPMPPYFEAQGQVPVDERYLGHGNVVYLNQNQNPYEIWRPHRPPRNAQNTYPRLPDFDPVGYEVVYTDGVCKGNGKPWAIAGIGVWWGQGDPRNLAENCPGEQTNNRAELIAVIRALETMPISSKPLMIRTDSRYVIESVQTWIHRWESNGWKTAAGTPVHNRPLIRYLAALLDLRTRNGQKVVLNKVKAHAGVQGNEMADCLASEGASGVGREERDWDAARRALYTVERGGWSDEGGRL